MNSPEPLTTIPSSPVPNPFSIDRKPDATSTLHLVANIFGAVFILGLGVAGYLFFGRKPEVPTDTSRQDSANIAPLVEVTEVKAWNEPFELLIDGEASTYRILTVGAEVTGRVSEKSERTRSGTFVNKGDLLFEIDPLNYQLEKQRLQARVEQASEELNAVDIEIQNTSTLIKLATEENQLQKNHLERIRALYAKKATSDSDVDSATQQELSSRNSLQALQNQLNAHIQMKKSKEASLKLAEAELARTVVDLERCQVISPITGRIVDDIIEEGDYIKPGDPLVHISDSSRMEIKCSLKEGELAWVWQQGHSLNQTPIATSESETKAEAEAEDSRKRDPFRMPQVPCEISFEFQGVETIWEGHLSRYEGTGIDRETRMFPCRVIVEEPEKTRTRSLTGQTRVSPPTLLSGMYVTVRIPITSTVPLLQVPAEAVRPGEKIWVVRNNLLCIVSVSLAHVDGEIALVLQEKGSLRVGDQIIVSPLASVVDGMTVTIAETKEANQSESTVTEVVTPAKEKP